MRFSGFLLAASAIISAQTATAATAKYTVRPFSNGRDIVFGNAINDSGIVTGSVAQLFAHYSYPFIAIPESGWGPSDIPLIGSGSGNDINNSNVIVGTYTDFDARGRVSREENDIHAFVYAASTHVFTTFGIPGDEVGTRGTGINNSGTITGYYNALVSTLVRPGYFIDGVDLQYELRNRTFGFVASNGVFTKLVVPGAYNTHTSGINDSGVVTGSFSDTLGFTHAFTDSQGVITTVDAPGSGFTQSFGINNAGAIVGTYRIQGRGSPSNPSYYIPDNTYAFLEYNGVFTTIPTPAGGFNAQGLGINDFGAVTGSYNTASGAHAFVYYKGALTTIDVAGADFTVGQGINNRGQITGYYQETDTYEKYLQGIVQYGDGIHGFVATPLSAVPEPSSWALMVVGLGGVGGALRSRRRKVAA